MNKKQTEAIMAAAMMIVMVVIALGCAAISNTPSTTDQVSKKLEAVMQLGTMYAIAEKPEWKQQFVLVAHDLAVIENDEKPSFETIVAVLSTLKIDEFETGTAKVVVESGTLLLQDSWDNENGGTVDLREVDARMVARAMRRGIEKGLTL